MSRNIKGGFLTLSSVVGIVGMIIAAMQNPATAWVTPPGRMIISIMRPFGEIVSAPFEIKHTASDIHYDRCGDWIEIISQSIYLKDCVV